MEIKTEEITSIKPVTDEKQEKHLYTKEKKQKKQKRKNKIKKIYYEEKGKFINIYA